MAASPLPECLERFHELAREFHAAVEHADTTAQESILAERRRLMAEIERAGAPRHEAERRARAKVLTEILELDRDAEALLERQREQLGAELVALGTGKRGLAGYGIGGRRAGKWIDERG